MSDAAGAAAAASAAGSAPAVNDAGAGAAAPPAAGQGQQQAAWFAGVENADHRAWLEAKGYPSLDAAIAGHHSLERTLGAERLVVPKDPTDRAAWDKVWNALGRPDAADKYQFQAPDGHEVNGDLVGRFAKIAHESGASQAQVKAFYDWYVGEEVQAQTAYAAQSENELAGLQAEWGAAFDQRAEAGRRAVREFGLDETSLAAIEASIGTAKTLRLFSDIGSRLGEHSIEGRGGGGTQFTLSPSAAQAEINRLRGDTEFQARYLSEDPKVRETAIAEMGRLHKLLAGEAG